LRQLTAVEAQTAALAGRPTGVVAAIRNALMDSTHEVVPTALPYAHGVRS
jgi:hypothetical protein